MNFWISITLYSMGLFSALVATLAYAWRNPWYTSHFGRSHVLLFGTWVVFFGYAILRNTMHWPVNIVVLSIEFLSFIAVLIHGAYAAVKERRAARHNGKWSDQK